MEKIKDFSLLLFDRDLTDHYHSIVETLKNASELMSTEDRSFDKQAMLGVTMIQSLMQYTEAVGAYCLACQKTDRGEFTDVILKYRPKEIHGFYSRVKSLTGAELNNILSYLNSSFWTSESDEDVIKEKMRASITQLKEKLRGLGRFWNEYHDFYNASKHGGRYWISEVSHKEKGDKYLVIQWLNMDRNFDTILLGGDELQSEMIRLADETRSIMLALHANRVLIWSSGGRVNPTEYRYILEE